MTAGLQLATLPCSAAQRERSTHTEKLCREQPSLITRTKRPEASDLPDLAGEYANALQSTELSCLRAI